MANINRKSGDGIVDHHNYADFDSAWEGCLRPWFQDHRQAFWENGLQSVLSCPNQALISAIKCRLGEETIPATGVYFTTPGTLRRLLHRWMDTNDEAHRIVLREDLHLIARVLAAGLPDDPVACAILRDPASLVSALDALDSGGWKAEVLEDHTAVRLGQGLETVLRQGDLLTVRQSDRSWLGQKGQTVISQWIAFGFSSSEWHVMPLLQATLTLSERSTLCFLAENERADTAAWTGTWEELAGPITSQWACEDETERPCYRLGERFSRHQSGNDCSTTFIVTKTLEAEVSAIMEALVCSARENPGSRIALVLASGNSLLGRELSLEMTRRRIPHHDHPGHRPALDSRHLLFNAWCAYQKDWRLSAYLDFMEALERTGLIRHGLANATAESWMGAFRDIMTEDMHVLSACLGEREPNGEALALYMKWPRLPDGVQMGQNLDAYLVAMEKLGWPESTVELERRAGFLAQGLGEMPVAREALLEWMAGVVDLPGRTRDAMGRESFAPVQILTLAEAAGQSWDVVILAGMNHEEWPAQRMETPFLPESVRRTLNHKVLVTGSQGEGHTVVKPAHTLMPTGSDDAARVEERLFQLIVSTKKALYVSVSLRDPVDNTSPRAVSEWFLRLYAADRGVWLDEKELVRLADEGQLRWRKPDPAGTFDQIRTVFGKRRDAELPFDGCSFSYDEPPVGGLSLPAKAWEDLLKSPAASWYRAIIHVDRIMNPAEDDPWTLARGTLVHNWVRPGEESAVWYQRPDLETWTRLVKKRADALRDQAERSFLRAGGSLPDWWMVGWSRMRHMAVGFVEALSAGANLDYVISELPLPEGTRFPLTETCLLPLRGRIDLVLADQPYRWDERSENKGQLEVVDFKTGSRDALALSRLEKGEGVQVVLYALALAHLTGLEVSASLLAPGMAYGPQLSESEAQAARALWDTMAEMHETGQVGDYGEFRPKYGFVRERPWADLPVAARILKSKWNLTHPDFPVS